MPLAAPSLMQLLNAHTNKTASAKIGGYSITRMKSGEPGVANMWLIVNLFSRSLREQPSIACMGLDVAIVGVARAESARNLQ